MTLRKISGLALSLFLASRLMLQAGVLDQRLALLEPLLNKEWTGLIKAPDGSAEWTVMCRFEAVWDGKVVKYTRATPERRDFEEGYIYWDDMAKKPAFFLVHSQAVFRTGFLSVHDNIITLEGRMTWPAPPPNPAVKQAYDFRNTFELLSGGEMVDRWFQNAFGPWRPGHEILFKAREAPPSPQEGGDAFDPARWDLSRARVVDHLGRKALSGTAFLKDVSLKDGVIEVDVAATAGTRSYPGLLFRVQDASNMERIYIRPHRSPFYDDALQYAPVFNGVDSWQLYHGPGRTAALDIQPDRWNHLRVVVAGDQARVFWNDAPGPALIIDHLARGEAPGGIGVSGPVDGTAFFSRLSWESKDDLDLPVPAAREPVRGALRDWELSAPLAMLSADFTQYPNARSLSEAEWQNVRADDAGLLDVSRCHPRKNRGGDCVLARTTLTAEKNGLVRMGFGYSDVITVYLNGRPIYSGNSAYQSRDGSSLGILGYFDTLYLPLRKGRNELLLQVGESSGGWGFCVRREDDVFRDTSVEKAWSMKGTVSVPESAVYDPSRDVCYVSSYFNEGREYVSRISPAGNVIDGEWITGLRQPTGMCIKGKMLVVVDRSGLNLIDIEKGEITEKIPMSGARMPNDVAVDGDGRLYVSDTPGNAVFRYADGKLEKWLGGLDGPNGLLCDRGRLLIGQNGKLLAADFMSRTLETLADFEAGSNIDGLQSDGRGNYLVSDYHGKLYLVTLSGGKTVLLDTATPGAFIADFAFVPGRGLIVIPTFTDNSLVAYVWKEGKK